MAEEIKKNGNGKINEIRPETKLADIKKTDQIEYKSQDKNNETRVERISKISDFKNLKPNDPNEVKVEAILAAIKEILDRLGAMDTKIAKQASDHVFNYSCIRDHIMEIKDYMKPWYKR